MISAGMIATVLTLARPARAAAGLERPSTHNARERNQTIRLSEPGPQAVTPRRAFAADRATRHVAANAAGARGDRREPRRAPSAAPPASRGLNRASASRASRSADSPRRTTPLATASDDTDGDGLPDAWERRYGLDPAQRRRRRAGHRRRRPRQPDRAADPHAADRRRLRPQRRPDGDEDSRPRRPAQQRRARGGLEPVAGRLQPATASTDAQDDPDGDGAANLVRAAGGDRPRLERGRPARRRRPTIPTPGVIEDDPDVEDDGGRRRLPDPPAPEHPDDPGDDARPRPAPAPDARQPGAGRPAARRLRQPARTTRARAPTTTAPEPAPTPRHARADGARRRPRPRPPDRTRAAPSRPAGRRTRAEHATPAADAPIPTPARRPTRRLAAWRPRHAPGHAARERSGPTARRAAPPAPPPSPPTLRRRRRPARRPGGHGTRFAG